MVSRGILLLILASFFSSYGFSSAEEWQTWKKNHFAQDLSSPTSFLNAISLDSARSGESLYLPLDKKSSKTRWRSKAFKGPALKAEHLGSQVRIKSRGQTMGYLKPSGKKRRKKIDLENGLIAEIVLGKRVGKMWTYLYDPLQIKNFTGFRFFPYNPDAVFRGTFKATPRKSIGYKTVQGDPTEVFKIGNVSFRIEGRESYLSAYTWRKPGESIDYIALIFVDQTAGKETYAGGRELVVRLTSPPKDGEILLLDFNKTLNFYCAHSPFWHCPVGLQEPIAAELRAGEMLPLKKMARR